MVFSSDLEPSEVTRVKLAEFWRNTLPRIRDEATDPIDKKNGQLNDCQQVSEYLKDITHDMK
jgi:hypothetical protein